MASLEIRKRIGKTLYYQKRPTKWDKGYGAYLPEAYKKFFVEWRVNKPKPVHFKPEKGKYRLDPTTGVVYPVQNIPIPLKFPKEHNDGLWGGEGIIQGFTKKDRYSRRIPRFWIPVLKSSVVYSEILDKYFKVTVTDRTLQLIHKNRGFDHYILKTPACDLKSRLGVKIKREILTVLANKTLYPNDPTKREEIYDSYKEYLTAYTPEEIEWYGLTFLEACIKWKRENEAKKVVQPLKIKLRAQLIEELKAENHGKMISAETEQSLMSKIASFNPFRRKSKTE